MIWSPGSKPAAGTHEETRLRDQRLAPMKKRVCVWKIRMKKERRKKEEKKKKPLWTKSFFLFVLFVLIVLIVLFSSRLVQLDKVIKL
jgi:hypothetical protein